ncbi:hypothetical protein LIER_09473 [Lithospermum erythrorhizon]|uniref:DOG1 domain-containing protein n=1 Tax=Lithospermum erythrorhizon TaxID=34254 RepID=A0AAV3PFW1_LITER
MNFHNFYQKWNEQLHKLIHQLCESTPSKDEELNHLVNKVMDHYVEYYRVKANAAKNDVLAVFAATWCTTLERSLHWIAGWRPTTAFHLVYTEASLRFETQIVDILRGHRSGDLGDLSPAQFRRVSELQCETVQEENAISAELAKWQACNIVLDGTSDLVGLGMDVERKMERLVAILEKADHLRLKTAKSLVELLTPYQAVEFLIAAVQLQFGVRNWGVDYDRRSRT